MIKKMLLLLIALSLFFASKSNALEYLGEDFENSHPEQIIVKFKTGVSFPEIEKLNERLGSGISQKLLFDQTFTVKIPQKQQERFLRLFSHSPLVEYTEPDYKVEAFKIPNDPDFGKQWALPKIEAPQGWDLTSGIPMVKIAILDTGIDKDHPDLSSKVDEWVNFSSSKTSDDLYGHGTHVAGIAAAATNNNLGVAGLGWESRLLSVKVLDDQGIGYHSSIADGIKWAAERKVAVINLSLGGSKRSRTLEQAIKYAWNKGVVLACAAGNSGNKSPTYPAYYGDCIATAATDGDDQKTSWSSYGDWVDVAAPGDKIYSTFPNHDNKLGVKDYGYGSGTSMATPHVAGLAALLFGTDGTSTNSRVRQLIEENADEISGTGNYWIHGRINVHESILGLGTLSVPVATLTSTPEPTMEPTSTPTLTPTPTMTITPTPMPTATPTPTPKEEQPWWCERWPRFCH